MSFQHRGARLRVFGLGLIVATAVTASAQEGSTGQPARQASPAQPVQVNGAGATFPYPIYSTWLAAYAKVKPDVRINYLAIGSSAGIAQLTEQLVFFGATDTPMTDEELQEAPGRILHFPMVLGAVVPIYNLPGLTGELKFDAALLADIFLGKVRNWNDPAVARLNSGLALPSTDIGVVYRSDSSGTSFIFADFLSKSVPEWRRSVGPTRTLNLGGANVFSDPAHPFSPRPRSLNLPGGIGAGSNEQVVAAVKQTAGTIGYVDLATAVRNKMDVGSVQNMAGEFVRPTSASITAAGAAAMPYVPRDFRVSITNPPGPGAYPISSFTWILLYERPGDVRRSRIMVDFINWALSEGQRLVTELGYAPLPAEIVEREMTLLDRIRVS
jgi:phosphate transport system substrate-binding protein